MKRLQAGFRVSLFSFVSTVVLLADTGTIPAQVDQRSKPGPGTINYIEGQVSLGGAPVNATGFSMRSNQVLATAEGFAEVLLTPGAFLRIGNGSEVRLDAAGLAATRAQINRGSAIVEVDQLIQGTNLTVTLGGATVNIEKKGLYSFDAGVGSVRVLDGKANVLEPAGNRALGKGDQISLRGDNPLKKTGFEMKAAKTEPLYVWSEARSRDESQANMTLAQNMAFNGGWYGQGWYWDPSLSFYSYLPGSGLLYSPFGWGFYSPSFVRYYGAPFGFYGRAYGGWHGRVGGLNAHVNSFHGGRR